MLTINKLLFFLVIFIPCVASAQLAGTLQPGPHAIGFRTIDFYPSVEGKFRVCIWYPAEQSGSAMKLSDYVETSMVNGSSDKAQLRTDFKSTLEFIFGITEIQHKQYEEVLTTKTWASQDATMKPGRWPVILCDTEPASLIVTLEYLASYGFVVVTPAVQYGPPPGDDALYTAPTRGLETALAYIVRQSYVDQQNISALGFGGGALAPFYLGMRSQTLKAFVNVEGGLFMPQSKTTYSKDYAPENFSAPLLHIVRPNIRAGENDNEFNAIHSKKYRFTNSTPNMDHHDFTTYGCVGNSLLQLRGNAPIKTEVFNKLHETILYFFNNREPDAEAIALTPTFKLEEF